MVALIGDLESQQTADRTDSQNLHAASVDAERAFGADEMFFSTTDLRGTIRSGNSVFARVSGYSRADLVGSPHNIVRHPDMPRIMFKLVWE
jgi:PAS domain-containing protein